MMKPIVVEASDVIQAPAAKIYAVLADYHKGHPAILPKPTFRDLIVEQGGHGAGTVIRVHMEVMGIEQRYHMAVSEPEPGRVLVERDAAAGVTTTFTVVPLNGGSRSIVTIATESRPSPGLRGLVERLINPPIARRIYKQELEQLAAYMRD
jgi:hypothetical protein